MCVSGDLISANNGAVTGPPKYQQHVVVTHSASCVAVCVTKLKICQCSLISAELHVTFQNNTNSSERSITSLIL